MVVHPNTRSPPLLGSLLRPTQCTTQSGGPFTVRHPYHLWPGLRLPVFSGYFEHAPAWTIGHHPDMTPTTFPTHSDDLVWNIYSYQQLSLRKRNLTRFAGAGYYAWNGRAIPQASFTFFCPLDSDWHTRRHLQMSNPSLNLYSFICFAS